MATPASPQLRSQAAPNSLSELARLFLRLGATAFGGPAVHISMMEEEVVAHRGWMSRADFLDFLGATNLIPGPNSTEMAIHIGRVRAGWAGLLIAGVSFILPAAVMVSMLAAAYVRYGRLPQIEAALYAIKPVVIVVIAQGAFRLAKSALKTMWVALIGIASLLAAYLGTDPLLTLAAAGCAATLGHLRGSQRNQAAGFALLTSTVSLAAYSLPMLFLVILKIGATIFGGGYVLVVFLRSDLIMRLHWLTEQQLLDAVAMGQVTPGPLFTTATFIGYILGGIKGAIVATVGIFLPAFVLVGLSGPLVPKIRKSAIAGAALDGINIAALALMILVSAQLGRNAIVDRVTAGIALVSAVLLFRYRVNSAWLVLGSAAMGGVLLWLGIHRH